MGPIEEIRLEELDAAATRPAWRLRFDRALERRFESDCAAERCRRIVLQNWVGLATYLIFMLGDWLLIRDVFWLSVFVHLALMTPFTIALNAVIASRPPVWFRESLCAFGIVLATAAILVLMLASRSPLRTSEHISVVLVILFATMVQRIRFGYVVVACVVSALLYVGALSQLTEGAPWERKAVAGAVFCGVALFSIIGCWNLEREQRANFLLRLRDNIRHRELDALSRHDPLTGAGNRRALDDVLAHCTPAGSSAPPTAILLFDIDLFKTFNDVNGHLAGDGCLRRVASLITANVRDGDVFRFGGEEFLVLLQGADASQAAAVAERIRAAIAAAAIPRDRTADAGIVTVSAGVAAAVLSETETVRHLIADADLSLYVAKRGGRDRVHTAPRPANDQRAA